MAGIGLQFWRRAECPPVARRPDRHTIAGRSGHKLGVVTAFFAICVEGRCAPHECDAQLRCAKPNDAKREPARLYWGQGGRSRY